MADLTQLEATATRQHGLLTTAQLAAGGFSTRQVERLVDNGFLERRARGVVRLGGTRRTWEQDLMAATFGLHHRAVASHRSALRLWGFRTVDDDVEVTVRYPAKRAVTNGIVHRSADLERGDVTWIDAIPVTTPSRSLVDAGLIFPESEVERMVHHGVATGLVSCGDLWRMRIRVGVSGRNGAGIMGRILDELPKDAAAAESGPEVLLRRICELHDLPEPTPQFPVRIAGRTFRVDLGYPEERVFLEYDGVDTHSQPMQIANDGWRQNLLVTAGWTPLRFTWAMLRREQHLVASTIRAALTVAF